MEKSNGHSYGWIADVPTRSLAEQYGWVAPAQNGFSRRHAGSAAVAESIARRHACMCLECGTEFYAQREGALYACERCTEK